MKPDQLKILFILSSYNLYGGTPKKTLELLNYFGSRAVLYVYCNSYSEFKSEFEATEAKVYEGNYGRNLFKHTRDLVRIVDRESVNTMQTQFTMGETLGFLVKLFRPEIRLVIAFVSVLHPKKIKKIIASVYYRKADVIVYVSKYVKKISRQQFPMLREKKEIVLYNGTSEREKTGEPEDGFKGPSILAVSGLIPLKNIQVLIQAMDILINKKNRVLFLYVAGDGPYRKRLKELIEAYNLDRYVFLLGYRKNIGRMLDSCSVFVHPSYSEGFGIVVAEAMRAERPIIVSDAGALPELIKHGKTGLVASPESPEGWADAIEYLIDNPDQAHKMGKNAGKEAKERFSEEIYTKGYECLYNSLFDQ